ncbi:MAG: DUF1501 domain-containing protein [Planctomycetes bacterium]|nr:DUF1501 domain-containing protein [Planctomycetota bacterium]MBL7038493.1 DUF1501 domain-containing protein [Pirellulaceae bacterium]
MSTNHSSVKVTGMSRREAMRRGLCGTAGMLAAGSLGTNALAAPAKPKAKAKSVIQIFLWGGMSHNDTWDPKPEAGEDYMGEFMDVVNTNVNGIRLNALFPELAKQADKYSLIRGMTHGVNGHETAAYLMQTGHKSGGRLAYPSVGAIFTKFKEDQYKGIIPPYVVLTRAAGRFSEEGFLGPAYKPFATGGDPAAERFEVEGVVARGISDARQVARRELLGKMDTMGKAMASDSELVKAQEAKERAYELILGSGKEVFDLTKEKDELRDRYGRDNSGRRHTFGQECLAARRMVEAGVPYITISFPGGWDTHSRHFERMNVQCPQLDQGLAALLEDLSDRGLLDSTLVWCTGEFGRGPKVDWQPPWNGGRNHYGKAFTVLVAGGGFKGGHVVGSTDKVGAEPKERPVYPADLLGSIYQLAGIDSTAKLPHPLGLEAYVLDAEKEGMKSTGLLTEIM